MWWDFLWSDYFINTQYRNVVTDSGSKTNLNILALSPLGNQDNRFLPNHTHDFDGLLDRIYELYKKASE